MTPTTPSQTSGARWRRAAELALPFAATAVVLLAPLAVWGRLPIPSPHTRGPTGEPDASLAKPVELVLLAVVTALVCLGMVATVRHGLPRAQGRLLVALLTGTSALFAGLRIITVQANLDAPSWSQAAPVGGTTVLAVLGVAILVGVFGAWLAGDRPDAARVTSSPAALESVQGQTVVWSGSATGRVGVLAPVALLAVAGVSAWLVPPPGRITILLVLPLVALLAAVLGQARVTIGPRGVLVALGWLGWPRLRVPLEEVTAVEVEHVRPLDYGGWGVRRVPGALAVVTRHGEAVRIGRRGRSALVLTVDGAAEAAGVLQAHRATAA